MYLLCDEKETGIGSFQNKSFLEKIADTWAGTQA